jgi:hypothetical protein
VKRASWLLVTVLVLVSASCTPEAPCLKYGKMLMPMYPNSSMAALGTAYLAIALTPVYVVSDVCVERQANDQQE